MTDVLETPTELRRNPMTSLVHSIGRHTLVVSLAVASLAGASGALASLESGSDYGAPDVVQLGYGPGGPPSAGVSSLRETAKHGVGHAYGSAEIMQLGYGPGGPQASARS
ncbi:MAG TPA: hypothetical protein VEW11_06275 [Gaiellaceae bacterium]|nr:hypothetical protein [Gaiellaceae bacterium]